MRLASARRRVRAFVDQISDLEEADFPHHDGAAALGLIKDAALAMQANLDRLPSGSITAANHACAHARIMVSRYTDILGFILRSTNVRNAFEVHFPLKRLIERSIGPDASLVMSSEWKFVPFTYPMTLDLLPEYVLVGAPASESGNVLIAPLAGHEIGHSAWRKHDVRDRIIAELVSNIGNSSTNLAADRDFLLRLLANSGGDLSKIQQMALQSSLLQIEEMFCDLFGLFIFGGSYIYAYEYFLAPGGESRSSSYPSSRKRVEFLIEASKQFGVTVEDHIFDNWIDSQQLAGGDAALLAIADDSVLNTFPALVEVAKTLFGELGLKTPNSETVERVADSLAKQVPDGSGATLPEIVTAGWQHLRARGGLGEDQESDEFSALNELMLKSVEVSEFRLRIEADA